MKENMQNHFNEKYDLIWLGLLFGALYLFFLGTHPLFVPDEGRYAEIAREMLITKDFITPRLNGYIYFEKPPFFYWLSSLSLAIFGAKEWALRLPNALLAISGILLTFLIAKKLFTRRAAWFSSCILGTSLLYFSSAHYINVDMSVSIFMMGCLYCFMIDAAIGLYIFAALAVLAKGLIGIVLTGAVIIAWLIWTRALPKFKRFLSIKGIAVFLLIALPWHILAQLKNPDFFNFYIIEQHFIRYLHGTDHLRTPKWALLSFLMVGLFPWTFWALTAFFKEAKAIFTKKASPIILFLVLWIAIIYSFFQLSFTVLVGYILPVLPAFALLLGKYFDEQCDKGTASHHKALWILTITMTLLIAATLGYFTFYQEKTELFSILGIQSSLLILTMLSLSLLPFYYSFYSLKKSIISLIILSMLNLAQISLIVSFFNDKSSKDIAEKIKLDYPNARVIADIYMQDLPFYLGKEVEAAKFPRELDFGLEQVLRPPYLLSREAVLNLWKQDGTILFVIKKEDLDEVKSGLRHYRIIYVSKRYLVIAHD